MFEGWHEFYLMAGGAAAVLIGLIFVVISLMQDRSPSSVLAGSRLYMGPIVLGVSFVLVLSAAVGIARLKDEVHWTDLWFYGVIPILLYLALGVIALALWNGWEWAAPALAAFVTAGLLLAIRNEWDLITWIAPRSDGGEGFHPDA